jgi:hypothetical protein
MILKIYHKLPQSEFPEHVSDDIKHYYAQGEDNLKSKNCDASVSMMRAALEKAVVEYINVHKKKEDAPISEAANLRDAIRKLADRNLLTPEMKSWADMIRTLANESLHKMRITEEDAEEIKDFTVMFLEYAFTLPRKVQQMTAKIESRKTVSAEPGAS